MSLRILPVMLAVVLLISACAGGQPRCERPQVHDDARLGQALSAPPELRLPAPEEAMTVPPASLAEGQQHLRLRADGTCLEQPPAFQPPEGGR